MSETRTADAAADTAAGASGDEAAVSGVGRKRAGDHRPRAFGGLHRRDLPPRRLLGRRIGSHRHQLGRRQSCRSRQPRRHPLGALRGTAGGWRASRRSAHRGADRLRRADAGGRQVRHGPDRRACSGAAGHRALHRARRRGGRAAQRRTPRSHRRVRGDGRRRGLGLDAFRERREQPARRALRRQVAPHGHQSVRVRRTRGGPPSGDSRLCHVGGSRGQGHGRPARRPGCPRQRLGVRRRRDHWRPAGALFVRRGASGRTR